MTRVAQIKVPATYMRGGTSKGAPLTLDPVPHAGWLALQEAGLSDYEKDPADKNPPN